MGMAIMVVVALGLLGVLALAVFPPRRPRWWRHHTRPLRRALRPGHYRS